MLYLFFALIVGCTLLLMLWPLRSERRLCMIITGTTLGLSLGAYHILGTPAMVPLMKAYEQRVSDAKALILEGQQRINHNPKDLKGWVMLGQAFVETQQWSAATNAFKQAVLLSEGNPQFILAYAKAMILGSEGTVSDDAKKALEMVLLQDPENPDARYFMAIRTLQDGKTQEAMTTMKALYHSLPEDAPLRATINRQIGRE